MVMAQQPTVVGVFDDRALAERAVDELTAAGFSEDQIRFSGQGTATGGILDRIKGLFTGKETTAAETADDFMGMGIPEQDARYYESEYEAGRSVVTVMAGDHLQEATEILRRNGGRGAQAQTAQTVNSGSTTSTIAQTPQTDYDTSGEQKIQLKEEQLYVTKERVQAGEVEIHKEVVSEEKTINVPVKREEVYIERHPVSGAVPSATPIGRQDEVIRVPVSEERVQVTKQPVIKEEIDIGKRIVQETQQVTDTVRREEARIDRTGDVNVQGADMLDDVQNQTDR